MRIRYCIYFYLMFFIALAGYSANTALQILAFQAIKVWRVVSFPFPGKQLRHTLGTWCYRKPRFKKEIFPLTIVKFEGYDFPAPHNSDAYLRHLYGDYMAIPEEKQIHTVHVEFL